MKRYVSIILLTIYVVGATQMRELLKLPMLVEHLREHRLENNELSFIDFVYIHYANGNVIDADYDKDMKLPFKMQEMGSFVTDYLPSPDYVFLPNNPKKRSLITTVSSFLYLFKYSPHCLNPVWQPPQA